MKTDIQKERDKFRPIGGEASDQHILIIRQLTLNFIESQFYYLRL